MRKPPKGRKVLAAALSAVLAGSLVAMPAAAYADETSGTASAVVINDADFIPDSEASTTDLLTGAASRAAMPSIEILGLSSVEESGQFVDLTNFYVWSQPKYWLTASLFNSYPSPYLVNYANNYGCESVQAVYNPIRGTGTSSSPNTALSSSDSTDKAVLDLADLVIGNGGDDTSDAIAYSFSYYSDLVATMYDIAEAADDLVDSTHKLRYGSATAIASLYEQYTMGTIGYVQYAIDTNLVTKGTVALVVDAWQDDNDDWVFQLMTDESAENDGTASVNRYLETTVYTGISLGEGGGTLSLATNLADTLDDTHEMIVVDEDEETEETIIVASASELASVNLIMVGGQQSSSNYGDIMDALDDCSLLSKTYFVENNGSAGAQYGVVMNSVENAQNVGRILGCLYPTIIDQQSWLAYYYETFYHIDSAYLTHVMNSALDGVRCWSVTNPADDEAAVKWNLSDAYSTGYSNATVANIVSAGLDYLCANTAYSSPGDDGESASE